MPAPRANSGCAGKFTIRRRFAWVELPATRAKRQIVLAWLAERFEADRRYPEREVNERIRRHHPDYAWLRRELVDNRFMQREGGVYWRVEREM